MPRKWKYVNARCVDSTYRVAVILYTRRERKINARLAVTAGWKNRIEPCSGVYSFVKFKPQNGYNMHKAVQNEIRAGRVHTCQSSMPMSVRRWRKHIHGVNAAKAWCAFSPS